MKRKQIIPIMITLMTATFMQGCTLLYVKDTTDSTGSTDRQIGFFGGCLPLWHYRSENANPAKNKPKSNAMGK